MDDFTGLDIYEDDLFISAQWRAWQARAKLDNEFDFNSTDELKLFEHWLSELVENDA